MRLCCFRDSSFHLSFFLSFSLPPPLDHPHRRTSLESLICRLEINPSFSTQTAFLDSGTRPLRHRHRSSRIDIPYQLEILRPATVRLSGSTRPLLFREIDFLSLAETLTGLLRSDKFGFEASWCSFFSGLHEEDFLPVKVLYSGNCSQN